MPKFEKPGSGKADTLRGVAPEGGVLPPRTLRYGEKGKAEARLPVVETSGRTPTLGRSLEKPKRGAVEAKRVAVLLDRIQSVISGPNSSEQITAALRQLGVDGAEQGLDGKQSKRVPSLAESLRLIKVNEQADEDMKVAIGAVNGALEEAAGIQEFLSTVGDQKVEGYAEDQKKLVSQAQSALSRFGAHFVELSQGHYASSADLVGGFVKFCTDYGLDARFKALAKRAIESAMKDSKAA